MLHIVGETNRGVATPTELALDGEMLGQLGFLSPTCDWVFWDRGRDRRITVSAPFGPTFAAMKVADVLGMMQEDGWYLARTRGSHRQYRHRTKRGLVTVAGKPSDDLAPGTLKSILKQARVRR